MKGRGAGRTPDWIKKLVQEQVSKSSIRSFSIATGLALSQVHRLKNGTSEPTIATIQKLADYFNETFTITITPKEKK